MKWYEAGAIGFLVCWALGFAILGHSMSSDTVRIYASLPISLPVAVLVIIWLLEQLVTLSRRLLRRLRLM